MQPTPYPQINTLLTDLLARQQRILGDRLVGLYLYGSLVTGDFDEQSSDIDLLAITATDVHNVEFAALDALHTQIVQQYPVWDGRIEIAYLAADALQTFKTKTSPIAVISPGEPFHIKEAGKDWLINWYVIREKGRTLFGPAPTAIIPPISKAEFLRAVQTQAGEWRTYIAQTKHSRPSQGYAILTMCRALYAYRNGEQTSKKQAAEWAATQLPAWAPLIHAALGWRQDWRNTQVDPDATYPETVRFVHYVIDQIVPRQPAGA